MTRKRHFCLGAQLIFQQPASLSLPPLATNPTAEKHEPAGLKETQGMHYSPFEHCSLPGARPADRPNWEVKGSDVSKAASPSGFSKRQREGLLQSCWRHSPGQSRRATKAIFQHETSLCHSPTNGIHHPPGSYRGRIRSELAVDLLVG